MLFNSYFFIFCFLPVALIGYFVLNHFRYYRLGKGFLVLASLYFYSYWNLKNLPIILASIGINYLIGHYLHRPEGKTSKLALLRLGLFFNIGALSFFKYGDILSAQILLPLGLSFYTLQQIAFLMDSYEGLAEEKNFLDYVVFVTFFPQLISGPIVHYSHMMPQIESETNKHFHIQKFSQGIFLFSLGLGKKVLISETFSTWVSPGFDEATSLDLLAAWKTSLSYTFQLYYDFSGYTDMAIGIACMFNVNLPQNFNSPFRSSNIIEFWSRWHMTLSQFINTYVFTPLVRSFPKINFRNTMIATFTAMFLAGVWHGSGWTYTMYGAIHGLALVVNHNWKKKKKKLPYWLAWFLTFNFVNISFVIFRAKSLDDASKVLSGMFGLSGVVVPKIGIKELGVFKDYGFKLGSYLYPQDYFFLSLVIFAFITIWKFKNSLEWQKQFRPETKLALACSIVFVLSLFGMNRITEFIYFKF
jgi:D-alanyl-lipoteichoic acid acyltransferase DltB (MBOAT superfamily)